MQLEHHALEVPTTSQAGQQGRNYLGQQINGSLHSQNEQTFLPPANDGPQSRASDSKTV